MKPDNKHRSPQEPCSSRQEKVAELQKEIRQLKREVKDLKRLESRFTILFNEAIDALIVIDPDSGRIIQVNKAALQVLGYQQDALAGQPYSVLFTPDSGLPDPQTGTDIRFYGTVLVQTLRKSDGTECEMDLTLTMIPWDRESAILVSFRDASERVRTEREREKLIRELQQAMDKIKTLRGLVPICAHCKKIRDDEGYWQQVEVYVRDHTEAQFSHGICPECMHNLYPELFDDKK